MHFARHFSQCKISQTMKASPIVFCAPVHTQSTNCFKYQWQQMFLLLFSFLPLYICYGPYSVNSMHLKQKKIIQVAKQLYPTYLRVCGRQGGEKRGRKWGKEGGRKREISFFVNVKNIIIITDVNWIVYGELDQKAQESK